MVSVIHHVILLIKTLLVSSFEHVFLNALFISLYNSLPLLSSPLINMEIIVIVNSNIRLTRKEIDMVTEALHYKKLEFFQGCDIYKDYQRLHDLFDGTYYTKQSYSIG